MITALIDAGKLARQHSTTRDNRQAVEVLVTEEGLVVRGTYRDALSAYGADSDVNWQVLAAHPHHASLTVLAVVSKLDARAKQLGHRPVRGGV